MAKQHYLAHLPKQKTISISFDISIIAGEMSFAEFLEKGNTKKAQGKKQTFQIISTPNELNALPESNTESNRVTTADSSQTAFTVTGSEPTKSPSLLNWGMLIGGIAILVTGLILLVFLQPYVGLFCIACGSGLAGWGGVKLLKKDTLTDNNDSDADSWQPIETGPAAQAKSNPKQFQSPIPSNTNDSKLQSKEAPSVTLISISEPTGTNEITNLENLEDIKSFQEWGEVVRQDLYQKTLSGEETAIKEILKDSSKSLVNTYKNLAKKYHPDRETETQQKIFNTEAFQKLGQVYNQIQKGWELALQGIDSANYFVAEQGEDKKQNELLKEQNNLLRDHISFLKEHKKILDDMQKEINDFFSTKDFKNQVNTKMEGYIREEVRKQVKAAIPPKNTTVDISGGNPTIHTKGF